MYVQDLQCLTLLVGWQEWHPVICLERYADLHMAQLMPLPLTVSCFSEIQIGLNFLVPAHPGSPGQRAVKRVCVFVMYLANTFFSLSLCSCSRTSKQQTIALVIGL